MSKSTLLLAIIILMQNTLLFKVFTRCMKMLFQMMTSPKKFVPDFNSCSSKTKHYNWNVFFVFAWFSQMKKKERSQTEKCRMLKDQELFYPLKSYEMYFCWRCYMTCIRINITRMLINSGTCLAIMLYQTSYWMIHTQIQNLFIFVTLWHHVIYTPWNLSCYIYIYIYI